MRYFKYKHANKSYSNALKEQYKSLIGNEKNIARKAKFWRRISLICSAFVFIFFFVLGIYFLDFIPQPHRDFWQYFIRFCLFFAELILFVICAVITFILTKPLWRKADSFQLPAMQQAIFSKSCAHLRDYYGVQEPYIITKCFNSSDKAFRNHDVCIFIVDNELRITTDLIHGFLHGERDLGCYAFNHEEILLTKQHIGNQLVAELKVGSTVFELGYRAKGFIEKNFPT